MARCDHTPREPTPSLCARRPRVAEPQRSSRHDKSLRGRDATESARRRLPALLARFTHGFVIEPPSDASDLDTLRGVLSIDARPGAKKFQGVWLATDDGERFVLDYRERSLWTPFDGSVVAVTGEHFSPSGQAIHAQHFRVHQLRFIDRPSRARQLVGFGSERALRGTFVSEAAPPGSKLEGSSTMSFRCDDGARYELFGVEGEGAIAIDTPVDVKAREVELNRAWAASPGGPHLWVASVSRAREPG